MTLKPKAFALSATADPMRPVLLNSPFTESGECRTSYPQKYEIYVHILKVYIIITPCKEANSPRPTIPSVSSRIRAHPWAASRTWLKYNKLKYQAL